MPARILALLLAFCAMPAAAQTSSALIKADPAAQYALVKSVFQPSILARNNEVKPGEQGYDLELCYHPAYSFGDWSEKGGVLGWMIVRAAETAVLRRDLAKVGFAARPLDQAFEKYEKAVLASNFVYEMREQPMAELEKDIRAINPDIKIQRFGGCGGPGPVAELNHATEPPGGTVLFLPSDFRDVCKAQKLDPDDPARCDWWMTRTDKPIFFAMYDNIHWQARWPDGKTARGTFRADHYCQEVGCVKTVTFKQP